MIKREDIIKAQEILRKWRTNAMSRGNKQAQEDVEHVMTVVEALYKGG